MMKLPERSLNFGLRKGIQKMNFQYDKLSAAIKTKGIFVGCGMAFQTDRQTDRKPNAYKIYQQLTIFQFPSQSVQFFLIVLSQSILGSKLTYL